MLEMWPRDPFFGDLLNYSPLTAIPQLHNTKHGVLSAWTRFGALNSDRCLLVLRTDSFSRKGT